MGSDEIEEVKEYIYFGQICTETWMQKSHKKED